MAASHRRLVDRRRGDHVVDGAPPRPRLQRRSGLLVSQLSNFEPATRL
jgi:hypothetical protein